MNRRQFVKSSAGLLATTSLGARPADSAQANSVPGIHFDFTGLFAFRLQQNREIRLLLLKSKKCGLKDEHAPLLMMPFEYYAPDHIPPLRRHDPPNIVRLGNETMAIWSLADLRLWMPEAHTTFDETDLCPTLKFDCTKVDTTKDPHPICEDSGWASLFWFASLPGDLLEDASASRSGSLQCKEEMVACTVRLTKGCASGRAPKTHCERHRKYVIGEDEATRRSFATQLHIVVEWKSGKTKLAIASPKRSNTPLAIKFIGIEIKSGLTPVSIVNSPLTHQEQEHYKAFYKMVGKKGKKLKVDDPCMQLLKVAGGEHGEAGEAAPYADCIPPFVGS